MVEERKGTMESRLSGLVLLGVLLGIGLGYPLEAQAEETPAAGATAGASEGTGEAGAPEGEAGAEAGAAEGGATAGEATDATSGAAGGPAATAETPAATTAAAQTTAAAATTAAAPATTSKTAATDSGGAAADGVKLDPLKEQLEQYWSTEGRQVKSIENRLYSKAGRVGLSILVGIEATDAFWWYLSLGARLTYNFTEVHALELSGSYRLGFETQLQDYLQKTLGSSFNPETDLRDKVQFRADLAYVWRPFYGKFGMFNKKLAHYDFNFVAGVGLAGVQRPEDKLRKKAVSAYEPGLVLGTGFSIYLHQDWTARVDVRGFLYRGAETEAESTFLDRLQFPVEFSLGFSYLF